MSISADKLRSWLDKLEYLRWLHPQHARGVDNVPGLDDVIDDVRSEWVKAVRREAEVA